VEGWRGSNAGIVITRAKILSFAARNGLETLAGFSGTFQAAYFDSRGPCETRYNFSNALFVT
jgi:hypothetical protein